MEKVYDTCCGIDVHKKLLVACLNRGTEQEVRGFGATTRDLLEFWTTYEKRVRDGRDGEHRLLREAFVQHS